MCCGGQLSKGKSAGQMLLQLHSDMERQNVAAARSVGSLVGKGSTSSIVSYLQAKAAGSNPAQVNDFLLSVCKMHC